MIPTTYPAIFSCPFTYNKTSGNKISTAVKAQYPKFKEEHGIDTYEEIVKNQDLRATAKFFYIGEKDYVEVQQITKALKLKDCKATLSPYNKLQNVERAHYIQNTADTEEQQVTQKINQAEKALDLFKEIDLKDEGLKKQRLNLLSECENYKQRINHVIAYQDILREIEDEKFANYIIDQKFSDDYNIEEKVLYGHPITDIREANESLKTFTERNSKVRAFFESDVAAEILEKAASAGVRAAFEAMNGQEKTSENNETQDSENARRQVQTNPSKSEIKELAEAYAVQRDFPLLFRKSESIIKQLNQNQNQNQKQKPMLLDNRIVDEILNKAVVLTDASFWYDDKVIIGVNKTKGYCNASYIVSKFSDSAGGKLNIGWYTRKELDNHAKKNDNSAVSERSKKALIQISAMHKKKTINYLPGNNAEDMASTQEIELYAESAPECVFAVFTDDTKWVTKIVNNKVPNIIPLGYSKKEECVFCYDHGLYIRVFYGQKLALAANNARSLSKAQRSAHKNAGQNSKTERNEVEQTKTTTEKKAELSKKEGKPNHQNSSTYSKGNKVISKILFTQSGEKVQLADEPLKEGGEGYIYLTNNKAKVAKIFKDVLLPVTEEKLKRICAVGHVDKVCFPDELLYDSESRFVGYTMPNAGGYSEIGESVTQLSKKSFQEMYSKTGWDRKALAELCLGLCTTFINIHEKGILMGDVNLRNIMVNMDNQRSHQDFWFVDCDSYQIDDYPCPVGQEIFTSPKIYEREGEVVSFKKIMRTKEDENYAVASLFFQILMLGQVPFVSTKTENQSLKTLMRNHEFPYSNKKENESGKYTPNGPYRLIWNNTAPAVKDNFFRVFRKGEDVSLEEWNNAFRQYIWLMNNNRYTRELTPKLYFDTPGKQFTDYFKCEKCGEDANKPKGARRSNLCPRCYNVQLTLLKVPASATCCICGKKKSTTAWEIDYLEEHQDLFICKKCRSIPCSQCKEWFAYPYERGNRKFIEDKKAKRTFLCDKCLSSQS